MSCIVARNSYLHVYLNENKNTVDVIAHCSPVQFHEAHIGYIQRD